MEKILLVEDSKPTIELINMALTARGYKVAFALNGIEAISTAIKWQPTLILMDIMMPEMDGYEACKILKTNDQTRQIPVIFLSALAQTFDKVKAFKAGGVDFLHKPIDIDELLVRIHTHITIGRLQNELIETNEKLEETVRQRTAELKETNSELQLSINQLYEKSAELEESEERYRMLVNNIMYPVLVSTSEGKILYYNQKISDFFGISNGNGLVMNSMSFWKNPELRKEFMDELEKFGSIENKEILLQNNSNKTITVLMSSCFINYYGEKAILSIYNDISNQKILEQQILTNTIDTEERERKRFAQELHDGLGPLLSATKMYLQWITQTDDKQDIPNLINKAHTLIDEAHKTTREISHNLSPHILQNFGFLAALRNFVDHSKISEMINVKIIDNCNESNNCYKDIGITKETILYRVLTESINNTLKHAKASQIIIELNKIGNLLDICYHDNGIGFDAENYTKNKNGLGLLNIKHRIEAINGNFVLNSHLGKGTTIKIQIEI